VSVLLLLKKLAVPCRRAVIKHPNVSKNLLTHECGTYLEKVTEEADSCPLFFMHNEASQLAALLLIGLLGT
jgi:hypothetical protein